MSLSLGATSDVAAGMLLDSTSPLRRHYEALAKNLLALEGRARSVVVTSPEPGAGCSSVCLGLGAALAGMGRRVAVVDCNIEKPNLHRMLGEPNFVGLTSGIQSGKALEGYGHEVRPGLLVVSTGPVPSDPAASLESEKFVRTVRGLEQSRELVLLDAPVASKVLGSRAFSGGFDGVMLVIHASRTSKSTARRVTDDLLDAEVNLLGVVLNGTGEPA